MISSPFLDMIGSCHGACFARWQQPSRMWLGSLFGDSTSAPPFMLGKEPTIPFPTTRPRTLLLVWSCSATVCLAVLVGAFLHDACIVGFTGARSCLSRLIWNWHFSGAYWSRLLHHVYSSLAMPVGEARRQAGKIRGWLLVATGVASNSGPPGALWCRWGRYNSSRPSSSPRSKKLRYATWPSFK